MKHTARHLAIVLGVQPSTITRDIKKGRVSATKNERGEYEIDASEIARAYPDRVTVDDMGNIAAVAAKAQTQNGATPNSPDATPVLQAKLEAAERLLTEREQTIADLRARLDREGEERRRLTALLTDQSAKANAKPQAPAPKRQRGGIWDWFS